MKIRRHVLLVPCFVFVFGCNSGENSRDSKRGVDSTQLFTPDKVREVTATGKIEPENGIVTLASTSAGIVVKLFKTRGDSVRKGEAIIQLDQVLEESRFVQVNSQVPAQRSQIEMATESAREAELTVRYNREQWNRLVRSFVFGTFRKMENPFGRKPGKSSQTAGYSVNLAGTPGPGTGTTCDEKLARTRRNHKNTTTTVGPHR
jgi:hypothetical protein